MPFDPASFNEAEADRLGNPQGGGRSALGFQASMRPRLIASEIKVHIVVCAGYRGASMRPRLIASEIARRSSEGRDTAGSFNEAEADRLGNRLDDLGAFGGLAAASMRPRLIASEIGGNHRLR